MLPGTADLTLTRGDDFSFTITLNQPDGTTPVDLTGAEVLAQIRGSVNGSVIATFDIDDSDMDEGVLVLSLDSSVTALLTGSNATGVWDLQTTRTDTSTDEIFVETWVGGSLTVNPDVTQP